MNKKTIKVLGQINSSIIKNNLFVINVDKLVIIKTIAK
jgi:hypothetical protein